MGKGSSDPMLGYVRVEAAVFQEFSQVEKYLRRQV